MATRYGKELRSNISGNGVIEDSVNKLLRKLQPHLWTPNVEEDFGDGSFGKRMTGNIVVAANTMHTLSISTNVASYNNCNGWIQRASQYKYNINSSAAGSDLNMGSNASIAIDDSNNLILRSISNAARTGTTNNAYDFWIIYTKI